MNKNTFIVVIVAIIFIIVGVIIVGSKGQSPEVPNTTDNLQPSTQSTTTSATQGTTTKIFTLAEVAVHNKSTDCWLAIEGKVYDVTPFIASGKHPGGAAILEGCGKDATTLFMTRPMGSGTPHSANAQKNLVNFLIGDLK